MQKKSSLIFLSLLLGFSTISAHAQWQWTDESGRRIFSDNPPPKSIPDEKILRDAKGKPYRPVYGDRRARTGLSVSKPLVSVPVVSPASKPVNTTTPTTAKDGVKPKVEDKNLSDKQKEEAKRKFEAEKESKKSRAEQCDRMRDGLRTLNSGARIARVDRNGEQSFVDDATRSAERKRIQADIDTNCK